MRNLIDIIALTESKGIANRKPGDVFRNATGVEMTFRDINFWPEGGGSFDREDLDLVVRQVEEQLGTEVEWLNNPPAKQGGFGLVTFDLPDGGMKIYGRYFQNIKPIDSENSWPNNSLPGFKFASRTAKKEQSGMQPTEVLTKLDDLSADDIIDQIAAKFGPEHALTKVAEAVNSGQSLPIEVEKPEGMSFTGFRDYFCEMLHPVALQRGVYSGNAEEAEALFLGEYSYADCSVSFGASKTQGLSDSILINPDGQDIMLSSKGASGAEASVKNLIDAVDELERSGNTKLRKKYKDTIDMIHDVREAGSRMSPVVLSLRFKLISARDANQVQQLLDLTNQGQTTFDSISKGGFLSKRLQKLFDERGTRDPKKTNPYYHLLAALAHNVANYINEHTDFSKAASDILNSSALVQIYTTAKETSTSWVLQDFKTVYPSKAVTGILFSAQKGYYSTDIKGNFTFKILKGGASTNAFKDPEQPKPVKAEKKPGEKTDITARSKKGKISKDKAVLGRKKR